MTRPCIIGLAFALSILCLPSPVRAQNLLSPVHGYLSVEPFELRKEFVFRFETLAGRLERGDVTEIDSSNRVAIEKQIGEWLTGKCPVEADGVRLEFELDRVHFVRPDPEKGLVIDDRDSVAVAEALVGVVFATGWDAPPDRLRVVWEVFPSDGSEAVVEAGSRENRAARKLTPANAELVWENEGIEMPELLAVPEAPNLQRFAFNWLIISAFTIAGIACASWYLKSGLKTRAFWSVVIGGATGMVMGTSLSAAGDGRVTDQQADEICYALLRNVYHAFDFRKESEVYDALAESASGDLLKQIYLEVQRSLQLENQGGARVRVTNVDLRSCELAKENRAAGGFDANCEWVAVGTVTHWGHTHDRVNKYRAKLEIAPVEKRWRLVGLALESEERIEPKVK